MGKIDFFDTNLGLLRERKHKINKVYLGNKYQLYAQQFCLEEMGYTVRFLDLYSMSDNKHYSLELGSNKEYLAIYELSQKMQTWTPQTPYQSNPEKCQRCIYATMCERAAKHD
jgi:CRISPR-associated protein Cas4